MATKTKKGAAQPIAQIASQGREFLSTQQAADRLGISIKTLYGWVYRHKIRVHKLGTSKRALVRIAASDIDALLDANVIASTDEVKERAAAMAREVAV